MIEAGAAEGALRLYIPELIRADNGDDDRAARRDPLHGKGVRLLAPLDLRQVRLFRERPCAPHDLRGATVLSGNHVVLNDDVALSEVARLAANGLYVCGHGLCSLNLFHAASSMRATAW